MTFAKKSKERQAKESKGYLERLKIHTVASNRSTHLSSTHPSREEALLFLKELKVGIKISSH